MQTLEIEARTGVSALHLFDEEGFLLEPGSWTHRLAEQLAAQAGIKKLTEKHWRVIEHIRGKFQQFHALPNMRLVCRATAIPRNDIYILFGSCLNIWRIAGLPNPGEEAKSYMS